MVLFLVVQVLNYLKPDRLECREKMEKTLKQLKWPKFPGLHGLVVKVSFITIGHVYEYPTIHYFGKPIYNQSMIAKYL